MTSSSNPSTPNDDRHAARNSGYGLFLFAIYLALYAGFMGLNVLYPQLMSTTPLGGVNLAILYGVGLIAAALILALIYMYLCRGSNEPGASDQ